MALVGAVLSATAMSWHGILMSKTARLAPARSAGAVTGGVLSFGQIGRSGARSPSLCCSG
jgi:hypothetical protein